MNRLSPNRARQIVFGLGIGMAIACAFAAVGSAWSVINDNDLPLASPAYPILWFGAVLAWTITTLRTTVWSAAWAAVLTMAPALFQILDLLIVWARDPSKILRPGELTLSLSAWWMVVFLAIAVAALLVERQHRYGRLE